MKRLLVLQPYVPEYRVAFFRELRTSLSDRGFELTLAAGRAEGHLAERGDDKTDSAADVVLTSRRIRVGGKPLLMRDVRSVLREVQPDLVIAEQAIKNLDVYTLLARQAVKGTPRLGLWGQGRAYSTPQGKASTFLKQWVTRHSDWFFAYTEQGADYVARHGMSRNRVTVLNNTVDTEQLRRDLRDVPIETVDNFRRQHSLIPGRTALFLGGVDPSKGIEFLLDAVDKVAEELPGFRLIVAGMGSSAGLVRQRLTQGTPVAYVGRLEGADKAVALRAADVLMIPEWVGLVAVDSLVAGCPIVTTDHHSHSPEFEYLRNHHNAFVVDHELSSYASGVVRALTDTHLLSLVRERALRESHLYSLTKMSGSFAQGVHAWSIASLDCR